MRLIDLIRKKRDGFELTAEEIQFIIAGYTRDEFPDYQISAWLMAVLLRGMKPAEIAGLTEAMLHSGEVLDLSQLPGKKVDKHSTGGVGDKTSLVLAPVAAAGGLFVPMISGRGLGHTGGTLDKLQAIPGFRVDLSLAEMIATMKACGCAMIGQTAEIAPADKRIYALRDVTGTVESAALICASIMSKKMAEGIDALVLDVKVGSGAFMKNENDAAHLAGLMVETGERMGKRVVALLTRMDRPLGRNVGNALEVAECIEVMRGGGGKDDDLRDLCIELAGWMFFLGDRSPSVEEGKRLAQEIISSGKALEKFKQMTELQRGDPRAIDDPSRLPQAANQTVVTARDAGFVQSMQCERIGVASLILGGGREKKEDIIDPAVGLIIHKKTGEAVQSGEPLVTIHYNSSARLEEARQMIAESYKIGAAAPANVPLVGRVIGKMLPKVPAGV